MTEKTPSTRDRILQATLDLLQAGGGSGVRMSDISRAVGISRQALYLHFPNRADLLVAASRHIDEQNEVERRLVPSRTAATGRKRLDAWIDALGNYIPVVHGVAKALQAMKDTDEAAMTAWNDRMQAIRHGCAAAIAALDRDGELTGDLTQEEATDWLWMLLAFRNWEHLCRECGWPQERYVRVMQQTAALALTGRSDAA
ncbi:MULTISPECIES: TetR/AcrR family transcriptional regulator [unclassified Minwuia]|jgi:AcrR family transcriptional regulator|uniref:TetR/AcrR family transcriptional regulator n=1 Tax=unclassified Minwuia TaxID=2618799 RepID=UPI002478A254|nr:MULTISPECIES: TetR/AcrR family transcriptional regulator [unclassified Minwuia]